ncbi:MAG: hypothetical protein ABI690_09070 [Chloroflexota bacterium]
MSGKVLRYLIPILLLLVVAGSVQAMTINSFQFTYDQSSDRFQLEYEFSDPVNDDGEGNDIVWVALVDCQGSVVGYDAVNMNIADGAVNNVVTNFPRTAVPNQPVTGRMVSAELYDTPPYNTPPPASDPPDDFYSILQQFPLKAVSTADLGAGFPDCPPGWQPKQPDNEQGSNDQPSFKDGRLNMDPGAPIVIYQVGDTFQVYQVTSPNSAVIVLSLSLPDLIALEVPDHNLEVAHSDDGTVVVYKLTSGELYVGTTPNAEGKKYVCLFSLDPLKLIQNFNEAG